MLLVGERISATRAQAIGLVSRITAPDDLTGEAASLAEVGPRYVLISFLRAERNSSCRFYTVFRVESKVHLSRIDTMLSLEEQRSASCSRALRYPSASAQQSLSEQGYTPNRREEETGTRG